MPAPKNPKEVKQFLGLVGYYRKFIPRFADISRVLTHLTKKDVEFKWTPECENCFQILKEFLQQAPILRYPNPQAKYTLYTDASKYAYAGILTQHNNGTDHPITYVSGLFRGSQLNWVTLIKEAYAIYMSVRDHTSKAFQPKYKYFCIVGLLGKNQVEIKDNHGHVTKVHHRDVKKTPMTEKVCKLYEEERTGKTREGRKAVPNSKMPDLAWDIAETQLTQEDQKENNPDTTPTLQTLVTIIILIIAIGKQTITQIKKIAKKTVQAIQDTTKAASRNMTTRKMKEFHRTITSEITTMTNTTHCTSLRKQGQINNEITEYPPGTRKLNDEYNELYQLHTSRTHNYCDN